MTLYYPIDYVKQMGLDPCFEKWIKILTYLSALQNYFVKKALAC